MVAGGKQDPGKATDGAQAGDRDVTIQLPVTCIQQFPGLLGDLSAARRAALLQIRDAAAAAGAGTAAGAAVGASLNRDGPSSDAAPDQPILQGFEGTGD